MGILPVLWDRPACECSLPSCVLFSGQVGACTKNMNTFGFVGDLNGSPEVSCVYHSEDGENQFLKDPKRSVMGDGFQPHELLDTAKKVQVPAQN